MAGAKRPRLSFEPDLDVEVEGEVFRVFSQTMARASPVWHSMLESGMSESTGRIVMEGKSKRVFQLVLGFIDPFFCTEQGAGPQVTAENVGELLSWAEEFDIALLRARCEHFLISELEHTEHIPFVVGHLHLAQRHRLPLLRKRGAEKIARCVRHQRDLPDLTSAIDDSFAADFVQVILPAVRFAAFGSDRLQHRPTYASYRHSDLEHDQGAAPAAPAPAGQDRNHAAQSTGRDPSPPQTAAGVLTATWPLLQRAVEGRRMSAAFVAGEGTPLGSADEARRGMLVRVVRDVGLLRQLCERCAPGAYGAARWSEEKKQCAGLVGTVLLTQRGNVVVSQFAELSTTVGFLFPFDALLHTRPEHSSSVNC
eukprot:TRINITY_DN70138_c0_g1_i1.p1 TRINITY_DN70138_c0_g1~~TRINITY_DN70138_c0_g1_i1.p1  ORF type:complete len:391 (+),score=79.83 TRINITY_DN70138_c0_g1_i1:75-1175(+)